VHQKWCAEVLKEPTRTYSGQVALEHTAEDERVVQAQLGRPVRGRWAVARRCHLGVPMVIENHPRLEDGSPFPTLFWLTCPILIRRCSKLEAEGRMQEISQRLEADPALRQRLATAIARYRELRDSHEVVADAGAPPGGSLERVKCLHAHTAHQLAGPPNPVGALTLAETGWPDCVLPCEAPR
jgi:hypothetical protein